MSGIRVINRKGERENLDITKIQFYTSKAVAGLSGVEQSDLETSAMLQVRDGMQVNEIQQTIIKTAVDKIDVDQPNWTYVAARLFIYDLYHKLSGSLTPHSLETGMRKLEADGRIIAGLCDMYDMDILETHIDHSRDEQFTYLGVKTLYDRYLLRDKNGICAEFPQHMFMGIAMFLASNEKPKERERWAIRFYDIISKFEVMLSTPTLSNARTPRHQLSSCYIGSTPDNIEGIYDGYKDMALMSKYGGGIGWDYTSIRAMSSDIDGHKSVSGGVIPFIKMLNDTALAVDQLGTRKGAIAVYLEVWHLDIADFLDLKKNSGEERRRAHDIFPALWICDLFMKRVEEDGDWYLFDPHQTQDLTECYGEEFEEKYIAYSNNTTVRKEKISAKNLWKTILRSYFETGSPFLGFKDTANNKNPNKHTGIIRSSNLCTEIFQNTSPNKYQVKLTYTDDSYTTHEENEILVTDLGISKTAKKITALDTINGKKVLISEITISEYGDTAVCNLGSINLSKIYMRKDIERVVPVAIRMLDNVIDLNFYPNISTSKTNRRNRAIGLGVMGEAQLLAESRVMWGSKEHLNLIDSIMQMVSYNAILASSDLAYEKGKYSEFEGSDWSKGIFPMDKANDLVKELTDTFHIYDWDALRETVKVTGMRNGYLMAIAPTSTISILVGTSQTVEPIYKKKWIEENLSGVIPVTAPNISPDTWNYYTTAYDVDGIDIIKPAAVRQKWIDQGQSINIFVTLDKATGKYLNDVYMNAWKYELKSTYYLRSQSPEAKDEPLDRGTECIGCQ